MGGGAQRPALRVKEPKKKGACNARAHGAAKPTIVLIKGLSYESLRQFSSRDNVLACSILNHKQIPVFLIEWCPFMVHSLGPCTLLRVT
jgi:hypothetical protein